MTIRKLPGLTIPVAFGNLRGIDWEAPIEAERRWTPVRAKRTDDRTLAIMGNIGEYGDGGRGITVGIVREFLDNVGPGDITVNINSPGGDFFSGLGIYNLLREHEGMVTVNVMGLAGSAASVIAMASDRLFIARAGFLMIHNASAMVIGNRHSMAKMVEILGQFDAAMAAIYADRSGIQLGIIIGFMDDETFFNGEDAVENGLADALLESDEIEEADDETPTASLRVIDRDLARAGFPRAQRRDMYNVIRAGKQDAAGSSGSTQDAASFGKQDAAAQCILAALSKELSTHQQE